MSDDRKRRRLFEEDRSGFAFREVFTPTREGPLPPRPHRSGKGGPSVSPAPSFTFPAGATALYSLRRAASGYAGMCVKVLRSSDGAHQDIGFGTSGNVDMAAVAAFCAGSLAYVSTWYDQSGNHNDLIYNTSVGGPPQINMIGTQPWLSFYGDQFLATTGTFSGPVLNGDINYGFVTQLNTDVVNMPMTFWDGSNGWFSLLNGNNGSGNVGNNPGTIQFYTSGGSGQTIGPTGRYFAKTNRYAVKRVSGVGTAYVNGTQIVTGAYSNNPISAGPLTVGGFGAGTYAFSGLVGEVYAYGPGLSDANRISIDANQATYWLDTGFSTPYSGTSAVEFALLGTTNAESIGFGNILAYTNANVWTVYAAVQLYSFPGVAAVIYTNVNPSAPWYGHEVWVNPRGHLQVRLMSNWNEVVGGPSGMAGVIGTTNVIDGKKHAIAYTYDGSSTAAGIKVYIDGNLETTTVEQDNLGGSPVTTGQLFLVGGQQAQAFPLTGTLAFFQIDKGVAQTQSYINTNFKNGAIPPSPPSSSGTTDICLLLNGGSGTTVNDTSGNGHNGTLISATMWVP